MIIFHAVMFLLRLPIFCKRFKKSLIIYEMFLIDRFYIIMHTAKLSLLSIKKNLLNIKFSLYRVKITSFISIWYFS